MTIKPWREVAHPHKDVLEGTFKQSEFAADISQVHSGTAQPEYQDPEKFFALLATLGQSAIDRDELRPLVAA